MSNANTITCTKIYKDIPFGHRQHKHTGHCAFMHGHNWTFHVTFEASELDECGFVIDFGRVKWIKQWIDDTFDHAMLLNEDDEVGRRIVDETPCAFKAVIVPDCSAEGIAVYVVEHINKLLSEHTNGRVRIKSIRVEEDYHNYVDYSPKY